MTVFCYGGVYYFNLDGIYRQAAAHKQHPEVGVSFVEISRHASDKIVAQLVGKDAVHDFGAQSMHDLRSYRLGGPYSDKRCFAMMDADDVLHSAIYVHMGNKPIFSYTDLAGDVVPILKTVPNTFNGRAQSFHCYSISGQLSGVRGMGPVLIRNLHHFLTTNYSNAVISTLSPTREFDKALEKLGCDAPSWARENDSIRFKLILEYLVTCEDSVQKFHMGNGAIAVAIRLSTLEGAGDSTGMNRCMINYYYHPDPKVLERNAAKFKEICKNGGSIINAGLVAPELIQQVYGMTETYWASKPAGP